MFGLLNIDKPQNWTSRDVVDYVANLLPPRTKAGHAGTLDPLATGVLVCCLGPATRLAEYVQRMRKSYRAKFLLGRTSDTEDVEGAVTELPAAPVPTREQLEQAAQTLRGASLQRPPAYSAIKVGGRRSYKRARAGQIVELAPREVMVYALEIVDYQYPELTLTMDCGRGTYVRSLGRDLAEKVGTGAVMSALVRTAIGPFRLEQAVAPENLRVENLAERLLSPLLAVADLARWTLTADDLERVKRGQSPHGAAPGGDEEYAALDDSGALVAILARRGEGFHRPKLVFVQTT